MKDIYIVESFEDNNWIKQSYHQNEEWALINADVTYTSRKCAVRVIKDGKIFYEIRADV
jgi:hypothetical protein